MTQSLNQIAKALVAPGKGILAADESTGTITKRLKSINVESTETNRQAYRNLLFTAPHMGEYISGVILYDETIRQNGLNGKAFTEILKSQGVIPGIKVDKGTIALPGSADEKITEGLDGLHTRLEEYKKLGAQFAKWRAVITIKGNESPSDYCLKTNAHALARYAALCQDVGIVPIVEPEVLMDGDHSIDVCESVTLRTLHIVFNELYNQRVQLDGMLLKPNMVISALNCKKQAPTKEIAERSLACYNRTVPSAVPGLVFLSGGQSENQATANLNEMNLLPAALRPWELSFSYGRALQQSTLAAWQGKESQVKFAQEVFAHRCRLNSAARYGKYHPDLEKEMPK